MLEYERQTVLLSAAQKGIFKASDSGDVILLLKTNLRQNL